RTPGWAFLIRWAQPPTSFRLTSECRRNADRTAGVVNSENGVGAAYEALEASLRQDCCEPAGRYRRSDNLAPRGRLVPPTSFPLEAWVEEPALSNTGGICSRGAARTSCGALLRMASGCPLGTRAQEPAHDSRLCVIGRSVPRSRHVSFLHSPAR